jgi:hypothetical protein
MSVSFKVTGLNEIVSSLGAIESDFATVRTAVLNEAARFLTNEAQRNVHVVSGRLKASIGIESQTPNSVVVSARTPYAAIENARAGEKHATAKTVGPYGTHDYFTRAIQALNQVFSSRIKINFDNVWRKHKTS